MEAAFSVESMPRVYKEKKLVVQATSRSHTKP
jgi:hypothetical protein